ncbi:uncharacterized protein PAC_03547 [Phialocephala subalpina]|uniref:Heterokaryon incompatibility domain-containing protein n=1 Tax=Phialocephala subalpina TaxID=576137 RepID=A0A1L7WLM8_9HELO|nr:uncharacterized protein PAC_03547 [Phialocephala subalpina]
MHAGTNFEMSCEPKQFEHTPLPDSTDYCHPIRLLYLEPADDPCEGIRCSILQTNLIDNPRFKALSYVWGGPGTTVPIRVNGSRYYVTPNCHTALQRLRELGESPLWIDAICINQDDKAEKARQIPLMGEIYSQARQVLVWLGLTGVEARDFGEAEENLAFKLLGAFVDYGGHSESDFDISCDEFLGIAMSGASPEKSWSALKCLLGHKWFTRLWVHQEATLATDCMIFTKHHSMSYHTFLVVACHLISTNLKRKGQPGLFLADIKYRELQDNLTTITWRAAPTFRKLGLEKRFDSSNEETETSLLDDLRSTTIFNCSDPRDRIYAILDLIQNQKIKEQIVVDYNLPLNRVYADATRAFIQATNSLSILCNAAGASLETEEDPLPSWVFNWRPYWRTSRNKTGTDASMSLQTDLYSASAGTSLSYTFSRAGLELDVKGLTIDNIIASLSQPLDVTGERLFTTSGAQGLFLWLEHFSVYPTGDTPVTAYLRTITADAGPRRMGGSDPRTQPFTRLSNQSQEQLEISFRHEESDSDAIDKAYPPGGRTHDEWAEWVDRIQASFSASLARAADKKWFFVAAKGYMGFCSREVRDGDAVVVLAGCEVPLIIRECGGFHVVVGECFVWGIMDGEIGEKLWDVDERDAWETFCLR